MGRKRILRTVAEQEALDVETRRMVEEALAGREARRQIIGARSAPADERALRGIPMIGGASGAIPGTVPHRQRRLERWSGRDGPSGATTGKVEPLKPEPS